MLIAFLRSVNSHYNPANISYFLRPVNCHPELDSGSIRSVISDTFSPSHRYPSGITKNTTITTILSLDCRVADAPRNDGKLRVPKQVNFIYPRNDGKLGVLKLVNFIYPRNDGKNDAKSAVILVGVNSLALRVAYKSAVIARSVSDAAIHNPANRRRCSC